jgi:hypothetical protein
MVLLAFSPQDQVDKFGAYVGIAAFFGLAILTLLYFAQAREVKRLREWAGRAPERAAELEQAVQEQAEATRRTPVPQPQPQPAVAHAQPAAAPVANGAVKLKPAEVAALAFARAAGVHEPHEPHAPRPDAEPAMAAAVAAPPTQVATVTDEEPAAVAATNGGPRNGTGAVPAPATPAARRGDPPPLPPRRAGTPGRRPVAPPPRRESNTLAFVLTGVAIVAVVLVGLFFVTRGGDDPKAPPKPNVVATPTPEATARARATEAAAPTRDTALIGVYNGTGQTGLARTEADLLVGEGYPENNLGVDTAPPAQQRQTSVVFYRRGSKPVATGVAEALGISDIQQLDDATTSLIANAPKKWNVVVIVGADKTS